MSTRLFALILIAALSPARGWADWPSFRGNAEQTGVSDEPLPDVLELLWSVDAPDGVPGAAAIVGGRVYIATLGGRVLCLELSDGSEVWRFETPEETNFRPGFNAPTTVFEETVFAGDEDGTFYAINRADGSLRWMKSTGDQIAGGATAVDTAEGPRVLFGSHDGTLYCRSVESGEEVWSGRTDGPVNCSVAIADSPEGRRTFVTGCDELFRVLDVETGREVGQTPTGSPLIASPAVRDGVVYFGSHAGDVRGLRLEGLTPAWVREPGRRGEPVHSSAAVTDRAVIVGGRDRTLHAYERSTGEPLWEVKTRSRIDSSPVVAPTEGGSPRVYVGTNDKRVLGVDVASGEIAWEYRTDRPVNGSPAVAAGRLVIGTDGPGGRILCFGKRVDR